MSKLTLGPIFYHWGAEKQRDFYFRIADEAPIDCVYFGEMVCSKREVFFEPYRDEVVERLTKAGKQVVISTLALLTLKRELEHIQAQAQGDLMIEANDVAAIQSLQGKPFIVGPTINVLNEGAMDFMAVQGAKRIVFASELTGRALVTLAAQHPDIEKEVQVYGRQPLAISMRCYHARANGRDKDHCRFACGDDPDGLSVDTLEGQGILTINGTQTLSHGYVMLLDELKEMSAAGVTHFRLAPQDVDMVQVVTQYRDFLDGKNESESVRRVLISLNKNVPALNGFYHGCAGKEYVA
ncbi:MAG: U32 family peptidase [Alphaproteobacteria bacterium]|jgi:collagenase-like PrtC family protease|nr:U32 family peptidase [Alphaproteobacteria bacterium]